MTPPRDRRPSYFVVGHPKCGTTALAEALGEHPGLFMSEPKEPRYFCPEWWDRGPGPARSARVERSEAEYLALFAGAAEGQLCGEATTIYLYSPGAAANIHAFEPRARIVMIFREPVAFLESLYLQRRKNPVEIETAAGLGEALALEPERRRGRRIPPDCPVPELLFYKTGWLRYEEHFDRFAERFGPEQILALAYEDFERDNLACARRIFAFLGVDPAFEPEIGQRNVGGTQVRSHRTRGLIEGVAHGRGTLGPVKRLIPRGARPRLMRLGRRVVSKPAPALEAPVAAEIRAAATPHVEALGARLGRDLLSEWGYSRPLATGPAAGEAR
jgi:hypothetical protein